MIISICRILDSYISGGPKIGRSIESRLFRRTCKISVITKITLAQRTHTHVMIFRCVKCHGKGRYRRCIYLFICYSSFAFNIFIRPMVFLLSSHCVAKPIASLLRHTPFLQKASSKIDRCYKTRSFSSTMSVDPYSDRTAFRGHLSSVIMQITTHHILASVLMSCRLSSSSIQ